MVLMFCFHEVRTVFTNSKTVDSARGEVLQKNAADCREISLALGGPDVVGFSVTDYSDGTFLCQDITHEIGGVVFNAHPNAVSVESY